MMLSIILGPHIGRDVCCSTKTWFRFVVTKGVLIPVDGESEFPESYMWMGVCRWLLISDRTMREYGPASLGGLSFVMRNAELEQPRLIEL